MQEISPLQAQNEKQRAVICRMEMQISSLEKQLQDAMGTPEYLQATQQAKAMESASIKQAKEDVERLRADNDLLQKRLKREQTRIKVLEQQAPPQDNLLSRFLGLYARSKSKEFSFFLPAAAHRQLELIAKEEMRTMDAQLTWIIIQASVQKWGRDDEQ